MNDQTFYTAIIGDIVKSRELSSKRYNAQDNLNLILYEINQQYKDDLASQFIITIGDEFQGLITNPLILYNIIWLIENKFNYGNIRLGIGYGTISTSINPISIGMDGPAWYFARDAIQKSHKAKRLGGQFKGFGEYDDILNALARALYFQRNGWTEKQKIIATYMDAGFSQTEIAEKLGVQKQVINRQVHSLDWSTYNEVKIGFLSILKKI